MNLAPPPARPMALVPALPYWAAGLGVACVALAEAFRAPAARLVDSFDDDAYYYFEVARSLVSGQGSSFDGLLATNGYHPLWLLALLPVFALAAGKLPALLAVKCLGAALFAATVALFYVFGRRLGREIELACALPILVFCRDLWLSGMETALLLPLLVLAAGESVSAGVFTRPDSRLGLTAAALAAALLARLDLVFFVALVSVAGGSLPPGLAFRQRLERIARLAWPASAALLLYMALNLVVFGTASPVSGQAKSLGGPFWNDQVFVGYLQARPVLGPLFDRLPVAALWLVFLLPALGLGIYAVRRRAPEVWRGATILLGLLLAANLLQLLYYAVFSSWPLWRWYHYYLPISLALSIAMLAGLALARLPATLRGRLAIGLPFLIAAGLAAKLGASFLHQQKLSPADDANYKIQARAAAERLNRELPPDAVLAMGDRAGAFGYFLDRPLVQVEGLVASPEFLEALAAGEVHPLLERLSVDYVVYSGGPKSGGDPQEALESPGCATFTEPKWGSGPKYRTEVCEADLVYRQKLAHPGAMGGTTSVWRYRTELNP